MDYQKIKGISDALEEIKLQIVTCSFLEFGYGHLPILIIQILNNKEIGWTNLALANIISSNFSFLYSMVMLLKSNFELRIKMNNRIN